MRSLSESHSTATAAGHVDTETASESGARAATGAKLKRLSKLAARGGVSASKGAEAKGKGKSAGGASASPGARRARQSHSSAAHADDAASGSGAAAASTDPTAARLPPPIAHLFPDGRMHLPEKVTLDDFAVFCEAKSQVLQVGLLVYVIYAVSVAFHCVCCVALPADNERDLSANRGGDWLAATGACGRQRGQEEAAQEEAAGGRERLAAVRRRRGVDNAVVSGGGLVVCALVALALAFDRSAAGGVARRRRVSALPAGDRIRQVGHQDVVLGAVPSGICAVCSSFVLLQYVYLRSH